MSGSIKGELNARRPAIGAAYRWVTTKSNLRSENFHLQQAIRGA